MYVDYALQFSDSQEETTVATHNSTNVVNLTAAQDFAAGQPLYLVINVPTACTSGGSATVQFKLVSDATGTIATDGSASEHYASAALAYDTWSAGDTAVCIALPMEGTAYEQYLAVQYIIGTAVLTAGAFDAFLTTDPSRWQAYPDAI